MVELGIRLVVSLGVVLGLFWTVARLGSRRAGGRDRALVRVRSRQALSRGSSLAVVEVGSRVLVVGVSDSGVRLLTELDPFELDTDPSDLTELPALDGTTGPLGPLDALEGDGFDGLGFASLDAAPTAPRETVAAPRTPSRRAGTRVAARVAPDSSALSGSLLTPATWKQAWSAATGRSYVGAHALTPEGRE